MKMVWKRVELRAALKAFRSAAMTAVMTVYRLVDLSAARWAGSKVVSSAGLWAELRIRMDVPQSLCGTCRVVVYKYICFGKFVMVT